MPALTNDAGSPERWQKWDPTQEAYRCLPCAKICDGQHEYTDEHNRKLGFWVEPEKVEKFEYEFPPHPWLAWKPDASWRPGKYLHCLLCKKWVQDFDPDSMQLKFYAGKHGLESGDNQKVHKSRLANLSMYREALEVKWNYHQRPTRSRGMPRGNN